MSDRLLKESDVLRAVDKRVEELWDDPIFIRKKGYIDVLGIKKHILDIPSANRPEGEWELSAFQNEEEVANGNYAFICSNCEHTDIHALTQRVPYCWWCGARMKGADDETTT